MHPTETAHSSDWQTRRHRALHFTLYPINYPDVDASRLIEQLRDWKVTLFTFFAGGYVTAYPSKLSWQPPNKHLPAGRDLVGEILEAADLAGIIAIPVIDLGDFAIDIAREHPEWAMWEADGSIRMKADGYAISSPCGAYRGENARELVRELKTRYGDLFKGIKWGGASYGFGGGVDYNPEAVRRWREFSGRDLPSDTADPEYRQWRESVMAGLIKNLTAIAREEGGVPTIGNSIWSLGGGPHFAALAVGQSLSQVEVQTRTFLIQDDESDGGWERFSTPIETTRYISRLTDNPPIVVTSYFLAWPWRRVAVPPAEQFSYLAQVAANGGSPMVNMTVGLPDQHEDQRGFPAISRLFNRLADWEDCFESECSAARLALVYDHSSACAARKRGDLYRFYLREMHQVQEALDRAHLPYDILDSENLSEIEAGRYSAIGIPAAFSPGTSAIEQLLRLRKSGTGLALIGETVASPLGEALGFHFDSEPQPFTRHDEPGPCQPYIRVAEGDFPLTDGLDLTWLAASGHWYRADSVPEGAQIHLSRAYPLRLFPEGVAYTEKADPAEPLGLMLDAGPEGAPVVCLAFDAGRCAVRTGHPDNERIIANALRTAAEGRGGIHCEGAPELRLSLRRSAAGLVIHLINTGGGQRYRTELPVLRNICLEVETEMKPQSVQLRPEATCPEWEWRDGLLSIRIDEISDYSVLVVS